MTTPIAIALMYQSDAFTEPNEMRTQNNPFHRDIRHNSDATTGKIVLFLATVDLILLVGLTVAAARILKGKIAMSNRAAYKMLGGASAILLLWIACFKYTFCCGLCAPSNLPKNREEYRRLERQRQE